MDDSTKNLPERRAEEILAEYSRQRLFPAPELISVQPMTGPVGLIFYLQFIYGKTPDRHYRCTWQAQTPSGSSLTQRCRTGMHQTHLRWIPTKKTPLFDNAETQQQTELTPEEHTKAREWVKDTYGDEIPPSPARPDEHE